jgi:hypothetical protein
MSHLFHLNYKIDKEKYRNIFYENIQLGRWHWSCSEYQILYWYQLFIQDDHKLKPVIQEVESDLNILGLNNFPRFSYQFPNSKLPHHKDEDDIVSININLFETTPTIHIEHKPVDYEAILVNVGAVEHGVEPDPNPRLILKFCLRHDWDLVYNRLKEKELVR